MHPLQRMTLLAVRSRAAFPLYSPDARRSLPPMDTSTALIAGIFGLGVPELVIILIILLVLFGGAKLPSLAKGLGQSIKEFKKATKEDEPETKPAEEKKALPEKPQGPN